MFSRSRLNRPADTGDSGQTGPLPVAVPWWGDGPAPVLDWTQATQLIADQREHYRRLSEYAQRWPANTGEDQLALSEQSVCSQNGEDGVIAQIMSQVGTTNQTFIEFGVESGSEGNCVCLADHRGWSGWFLEASPEHFTRLSGKYHWNDRVKTVQSMVSAGMLIPSSLD